MNDSTGSGPAATAPGSRSLTEPCQAAIEALERALGQPPGEVPEEVDVAERAVVRLRDELIERLRRQTDAEAAPSWRAALGRANASLSLIAGVEYPASSIQRELLGRARDHLQELLDNGLS